MPERATENNFKAVHRQRSGVEQTWNPAAWLDDAPEDLFDNDPFGSRIWENGLAALEDSPDVERLGAQSAIRLVATATRVYPGGMSAGMAPHKVQPGKQQGNSPTTKARIARKVKNNEQ